MRGKTWVGVLVALVALVLLVRNPGPAGAAGPSTIARGLPAGAVAYLEADDLGQLVKLWTQGSRLGAAWEASAANAAYQKTFVYLRLVQRLGKLEALAGFDIDAAALVEIFARGGGVAVYDVSDTLFVAEAQLSAAELTKTRLAAAQARLPHRSYAGIDYVVAEEKGVSLLFAQIGARLVASNSVDRFHEAIVLVAREEHVKTDGTAAGPTLADDPVYAGLLKAAPSSARVRVYARLSALRGTHQFDDFWIFGKTSRRLDGVEAALLALTLAKGEVRETRLWAYSDKGGGKTGPSKVTGARVDVARTAARLPKGGVWVGTELTDGTLAAERIVRLLPSEAKVPSACATRLAPLLAAAGATRMLEMVTFDTAAPTGKMPEVHRGGAVAVRLAAPAKLDHAAFEKAITDELHASFADGTGLPMAFVDAQGARTLAAPFVDEWGLTVAAAGDSILIVATDARLAARLATELTAPDGAAALLADGAPTTSRLDLALAARSWHKLADAISGREAWSKNDDLAFVEKLVPSALDAVAASAATVSTAAWAEGAYTVEEMVAR